jgi:hypothetical protein
VHAKPHLHGHIFAEVYAVDAVIIRAPGDAPAGVEQRGQISGARKRSWMLPALCTSRLAQVEEAARFPAGFILPLGLKASPCNEATHLYAVSSWPVCTRVELWSQYLERPMREGLLVMIMAAPPARKMALDTT